MRSKIKGVSLIELLIVVILISTVATAFLNFRNNRRFSASDEFELSAFDSAFYSVLDEISLEIRMANSRRDGKTVTVEHLRGTDRITINTDNYRIKYQIDDEGRLIRQAGDERRTMATDALCLKIRDLGRETVVLTLVARPAGNEIGASRPAIRSYSRVVPLNFPLQ
jgi:hypothetical protein